MTHRRSKLASFILENSLLLLAGTGAAVVWANLDVKSYEYFAHPLHFWVNDLGMVFFFALAAKEVFEATLPGGALASPVEHWLRSRSLCQEACIAASTSRGLKVGLTGGQFAYTLLCKVIDRIIKANAVLPEGTHTACTGNADRSHAGFRRQVAEREQNRRAGARRTVPHRGQLLPRRRDRCLRLPHHRARGPHRARRRLSHHREDDHGEHREARLRHQGRQSAAELGTAPRSRGRTGGAPAGLGCPVVGQ